MKPAEKKPPAGAVEPSETIRAIGLCAIILCLIPIIVLVPITINPGLYIRDALNSFYAPKFWVLMVLSMPLLVAVLGTVIVSKRRLLVPVLIPTLAFLGASVLSTIFAENPAYSLLGDRYQGLVTLTAQVLLFYATARFLDSWVRVRTFLWAGVVTAAIISIYGIMQQFELDPIATLGIPWFSGARVPSTLAQPVHLAAYLTLMMGITLALYFGTERRWARWVLLGVLALEGACWLYTFTRSSVLGVGLAALVILWLAYRRTGTVKPLVPPLVVLTTAVLVAQFLTPRPATIFSRFGGVSFAYIALGAVLLAGVALVLWLAYRRIGSIRSLLLPIAVLGVALVATVAYLFGSASSFPEEDPAELLRDPRVNIPQGTNAESWTVRVLTWRDTVPVVLERPILGHGPDNFAEPFARNQGEDLRIYFAALNARLDNAHNEFLQVMATTGILGLAAYLWVLVAYFRNVLRRRRGLVLLALSGGVLAYLLQIQLSFTVIANGVMFWTVLGISVAVIRLQDREGTRTPEKGRDSGSSVGSAPE